jgi:hypothetical protein
MTFPVVVETKIEDVAKLSDGALELVGGGGVGEGGTGKPSRASKNARCFKTKRRPRADVLF